jgi:hypothetical protein
LRIAATVLVLFAAALVATSISIVPPLSVRFATLSGDTLPRAYVAYRHLVHRFN